MLKIILNKIHRTINRLPSPPIEQKSFYVYILLIIFLADLAVINDIPYLRQVFGFLFLSILPGLLILYCLQLDGLPLIYKIVFSSSLSISFCLFFGFFLDRLAFLVGYPYPLSKFSILISFSLMFCLLLIYIYHIHGNIHLKKLHLFRFNRLEAIFLIISLLLPTLAAFSVKMLDTTNNSAGIIFIVILIPIFIVCINLFPNKFGDSSFAIILYLISLSVLFLLSLRSNHIIGVDIHEEYYAFLFNLEALHWVMPQYSLVNACLSISILPVIYEEILSVPTEWLFKILYAIFFSIAPISVYILSCRFIRNPYAFLAAVFFISQPLFPYISSNPRTSLALLFVCMAVLSIFDRRLDTSTKKILLSIFFLSCMVSHYTTTYIFMAVLLGMYIIYKIYTYYSQIEDSFIIDIRIILFFLISMFLWYGPITNWLALQPFSRIASMLMIAVAHSLSMSWVYLPIGIILSICVYFIIISKNRLNLDATNLIYSSIIMIIALILVLSYFIFPYIYRYSTQGMQIILGKDLLNESLSYKINFLINWIGLAFVVLGLIYCSFSFGNLRHKNARYIERNWLREPVSFNFLAAGVVCIFLLAATIIIPFLSAFYDPIRTYAVMSPILSIFFVFGCIAISGRLKINSLIVILSILLPYFFCTLGGTYAILEEPRSSTIFGSWSEEFNITYTFDEESSGSKWLNASAGYNAYIYSDVYGALRLLSQGEIEHSYWLQLYRLNKIDIIRNSSANPYYYYGPGYVFERRYNLISLKSDPQLREEYMKLGLHGDRIYSNGKSEAWKLHMP